MIFKNQYFSPLFVFYSFCVRNQRKILPFSIFFLSFLVRLGYWWMNPVLSRDSCYYCEITDGLHEMGHNYLLSDNIILHPTLLFEIVNLLMYFGFSASVAGVYVNIFFGAFVPLLVYAISQQIFPQKCVSIYAAFLISLNPSMIKLSVQYQRDMFYLFLMGLLIWFLCLSFKKKRYVYCVLAGIVASCGCFVRYESFEMFFFFMFAVIAFIIKKKIPWKRGVILIVIFMTSAITFGIFFVLCTGNFCYLKKVYLQYWNEKIELINKINSLKSNNV